METEKISILSFYSITTVWKEYLIELPTGLTTVKENIFYSVEGIDIFCLSFIALYNLHSLKWDVDLAWCMYTSLSCNSQSEAHESCLKVALV